MGHLFMTYAHADAADLAADLRRDLEAAGYSLWSDRRDIDPDGYFDAATERAIHEADAVIALLTPEVVRPDSPVRLEVAHARAADVPVIPVQFPDGGSLVALRLTRPVAFRNYSQCLRDLRDRLRTPREAPVLSRRREREIAYAQRVAERFTRWRVLEAGIPRWWEPPVPVRWAAPKHLNLAYAVHREIGVAGGGGTRVVDQAEDLGRAVWLDRTLIVGAPGGGKTITLRWLAYHFALTALDDEAAALPVIVPLGGFAGGDLSAYIEQFFGGLNLIDYLPDRVLVMLDGMDELPAVHIKDVFAWVHVNRKTPLVITCRTETCTTVKGLPLRRVDLLPLDVHRIHRFIGNYLPDAARDRLFWTLAGQEMEELWALWRQAGLRFADFWSGAELTPAHHVYYLTSAGQEALYNDMHAAWQERDELPGLLGLVRNPFSLLMAVQVFAASGTPPRDQQQLYSAFVTLLLTQHNPREAVAALKDALSELSARMQAADLGTTVAQSWVLETLAQVAPEDSPASILGRAKRAGLLVSEGVDQVRLRHPLLQDYFAARAISRAMRRGEPAAVYWPDGTWWARSGWEESLLLLAGMHPAAQGGAAAVVAWLNEANPVLACRVLTDFKQAEHNLPLARQVQVRLVAAMTGDAPPAARAAAGRILNRLGDPRAGVGLRGDGVPDFNWIKVQSGPFVMGSNRAQDKQAWENETPQQEVTVATFFVARYPVTNAQFQMFLDDPAGYNNPAWWTEAGLEWKGDRTAPDQESDPVFLLGNHPRVCVTWYEANAFCRWASARLGYAIRLLTEAEWEKAARGPEGRRFPYGEEFIADYANIDQSGIGHTSPVGAFPQDVSPYGLLDMSGNVREWCLSKWRSNYIAPEVNDPVGTSWRVLRGGSWRSLQWAARGAARRGSAPHELNAAVGFRVGAAAPM
ncbi:MAG: SUMF1/EgtB/PvdO family nonheme iron enzyme [Anaerolineae bacterium]|nr:SUMF1/EgtB/PvdO family nonheme iron enzyme [Anaerolineae bacterium]